MILLQHPVSGKERAPVVRAITRHGKQALGYALHPVGMILLQHPVSGKERAPVVRAITRHGKGQEAARPRGTWIGPDNRTQLFNRP